MVVSTSKSSLIKVFFYLCALSIALLTQFLLISEVPGLHYDEAWQGLFAHRISSEASFWPTEAMNSYTWPIVHYFLAVFFKVSAPTLHNMRFFLGSLNILSLILCSRMLIQYSNFRAGLWLIVFWALLPLSVHNHRFYVEMTYFFGFCFSICIWALHKMKDDSRWGAVFIFSTALATYSHVLFSIVPITIFLCASTLFKNEKEARKYYKILAITFLVLLPIPFRMLITMKKFSPLIFLLAYIFCAISCIISFRGTSLDKKFFEQFISFMQKGLQIVAIPFLCIFLALTWNGFWPYAQVTGDIKSLFLPYNVLIFLYLLFHYKKNPDALSNVFFRTFLVSFALTNFMVYKQSPRYFMIPSILLMTWCSYLLSKTKNLLLQIFLLVSFLSFNGWGFFHRYIYPFQDRGATREEFSLGIFHDTSRDFRPFQKVFRWIEAKGCGSILRGVEDDRFLRAVEFLQLTTPKEELNPCAWKKEDLTFHSIPKEKKDYPITDELIYTHPSWGDLGIWKLKPEYSGKMRTY